MIAPVVDAEFLQQHPDAVVADVRWYLDGRDGFAAFRDGHLPGARWVDLDRQLSAPNLPATEGRHPLPAPEPFAAAMSTLGIGDDTVVVAYDDAGGAIAGRLVVMLRMLGHDAALLDGGLGAWLGPIETGPGTPPRSPARFTAIAWPAHRLADAATTADAATNGAVVLDARSADRYAGDTVLVDKCAGHVPGARNAPASAVLTPNGRLKSSAELREHFAGVGVGAEGHTDDVITYCGSGVSACLNVLAMEHAGLPPARLYVASWSGWSAEPDRPAELGG